MSSLSTPKLVLRTDQERQDAAGKASSSASCSPPLSPPLCRSISDRSSGWPLNLEIDRLGRFQSKLLGFAYYIPFTKQRMAETDRTFEELVDEHISEIYVDHRRFRNRS